MLGCLDMGFRLYDLFGFEPKLELSTRPDERLGSDETWDHAEGALAAAMKRRGLEYDIGEGEGTFYGPKIDLHMRDSIGRSWQLGTVQLDYQMPERFGLEYTGADNEPHRPVMVHRALLGSFERFIGILTEHYAGEFPVWLAPVQAIVLPIADRHLDYAREVAGALREARGARRGGRAPRVDGAQDPRRRAAQDPLHADRGGPRAGGADGRAARAPQG